MLEITLGLDSFFWLFFYRRASGFSSFSEELEYIVWHKGLTSLDLQVGVAFIV
jgi:hypothetical protein